MAPVGEDEAAGARVVPGSVVGRDGAAVSDDDAADSDTVPADTDPGNPDPHDAAPDGAAPSEATPSEAAPDDADGSADASADETPGYDETSGIVYEVQPRGLEIFGLKGEDTPAGKEPPGRAKPPAAEGPAGPQEPAEPPTREQTAVEGIPPLSVSLSAGGGKKQPPPLARHSVFNTAVSTPDRTSSRSRREEPRSQDNPFWKLFRRAGADPADGDPPLTRFRDLPLDQKMHYWRIRAIIVIVVGFLFSMIVNWQVGITLAIIAGIADTVYRARTVESHAYVQTGTIDRATYRAQRRTIKQLAAMERSGYRSLHRRPIPDSEEVIDHLVVGPTGVYAIDSEKWSKELPVRQSNGKKLWVGPESKTERLDHANWEAGQASERLSARLGMEITVQPALAIYGPKISWVVLSVRGVDVFAGNELKQYLKRRARRKGLPRLSHEEIRKIYEAAGGVLPTEWQDTAAPVG